jgi:peroxiredoxin
MFGPLIGKKVLNPRVMPSDRLTGNIRHAAAAAVIGFWWIGAVMITSVLCPPATAHASDLQQHAAAQKTAEKTPDFVLRDLNGQRFRLSDFRGKKPVLIIFTATWCTFCKDEIPRFKHIHETYAKRGLEIVNIDIMESKEKVAKFTARQGLPYRILLDEDGIVAGIYNIRGVPSVVLVDVNGNISCRECQRVEPLIESLLKNK